MKIIKYVLTPDGNVPDYVIDGGYFSVENNNPFPQNVDLVGIANDNFNGFIFESKLDLLNYLNNNNFVFYKHKYDIDAEISISNEKIVDDFWTKIIA